MGSRRRRPARKPKPVAKRASASRPAARAGRGRNSAAVTWFVYMLECKGKRIYTGITPDVAARFEKHKSGRGAAFTRINPPLRIIAAKRCGSRSQALKAEHVIKQFERNDKLLWASQWPVV